MADNEEIEDNIEEPLTKPKKPRTPKQIEAFEKVKEKRKQNIELKKQEKLLNSAKLLVEEETKKQSSLKPIEEIVSESESEEEEIIVAKSKT